MYSTLAQIPVLLMWVYTSWLTLLAGAELSFAYQNESTYAMERLVENASYAYKEAVGIWAMAELCRRFDAGEPGLTIEQAAMSWNVPSRLLNDTLRLLEEARLVVRSASEPPLYQPARSLDKITVRDVVACLREAGKDPSELRQDPAYGQIALRALGGTVPPAEVTMADLARSSSGRSIQAGV
jgi:membrane protein